VGSRINRAIEATSPYRGAMSGLVNAAREVKDQGTFSYVDTTMATPPELNNYMSHASPQAR
jgi:hypothetical protein